jgi:hypothetical protein
MKKIILVLVSVFCFIQICMANGDTYERRFVSLVNEVEKLHNSDQGGAFDYDKYGAWYNNFKTLKKQFLDEFSASRGSEASFKLMEEGFSRIEDMDSNFDLARQSLGSYKNLRHVLNISSPGIKDGMYTDVASAKRDSNGYQRKARKSLDSAYDIFLKAKSALLEKK